jgi:hypothetical protein
MAMAPFVRRTVRPAVGLAFYVGLRVELRCSINVSHDPTSQADRWGRSLYIFLPPSHIDGVKLSVWWHDKNHNSSRTQLTTPQKTRGTRATVEYFVYFGILGLTRSDLTTGRLKRIMRCASGGLSTPVPHVPVDHHFFFSSRHRGGLAYKPETEADPTNLIALAASEVFTGFDQPKSMAEAASNLPAMLAETESGEERRFLARTSLLGRMHL